MALEYVTGGDTWVVLQGYLKLSNGILALESSRRCRARSVTSCTLPMDTWYELQDDLHMALLKLGLEVPRR